MGDFIGAVPASFFVGLFFSPLFPSFFLNGNNLGEKAQNFLTEPPYDYPKIQVTQGCGEVRYSPNGPVRVRLGGLACSSGSGKTNTRCSFRYSGEMIRNPPTAIEATE